MIDTKKPTPFARYTGGTPVMLGSDLCVLAKDYIALERQLEQAQSELARLRNELAKVNGFREDLRHRLHLKTDELNECQAARARLSDPAVDARHSQEP